MAGPLDVLLNLYGVSVRSVRNLRGGNILLELFAIEPTTLAGDNWNQLRDVLRSYFPQLDTSLNIGKCCHGDVFELGVAAALSLGALIAQDFSRSSASPEQELTGRLKTLCDYRGPEVDAIKDFCEVVCTGERVAAKVREIVATWMESAAAAAAAGSSLSPGGTACGSTPDLLSVSNCSSASSSSSCRSALRPPASPLYALRTPENHQRVRDKYSQDIIKLRRELLLSQDRCEHIEAESRIKLDAKEKEIRQLQARQKILREMLDQEQSKENRLSHGQDGIPGNGDSVAMSRLKVAQKAIEQLKSYEQRFFDEKARAEELETKILHGEKKMKESRAQIQTLELLINERDNELLQATDKIVELKSRIEDERLQRSFARQRNRSEDTLDNVSGENMGEAVEAILVEEHRKMIEDLQGKLKSFEANLRTKEHDLAEAVLNGNMKQEQIESQGATIGSLREQISDHTETISQAAVHANELTSKLAFSIDECNRLREELVESKLIRNHLEEVREKNKHRAEQLAVEVEQSRAKLCEMERIKQLVEEQFKAQSGMVEDLRRQVSAKTDRVGALESDLSRATNMLTTTVQSLNNRIAEDSKQHSEEKSRLEQKVVSLEGSLSETSLQIRTLYEEMEKLKIERAEMHTQLNLKIESVVRLERERASVEDKLRLAEEEKRSFEVSFKQAAVRLEELKARGDEATAESERVRISEAETRDKLHKIDSALGEKTAAVQRFEKENNDLKKNYIAICSQRDKTAETNSELKASIGSLKTTVAELETAIAEKDKKLSKEKAQHSELSDALSKEVEDKQFIQETLNEASRTLAAREKQIVEMTQMLSSLSSELESTKNNLATKDGTLKIVEAQLDQVNLSAKSMSEALTVTQNEKAEIAKELELANKTFAELEQERVTVARQTEAESNEKILQLTLAKEAMAEDVNKMSDRVATLESDLEAARQDNVEAAKAVTTARQELQKAQADIAANTQTCAEISKLKDEIEILQRALDESQNECAIHRESSASKDAMLDNSGRSVELLQAECERHLSKIDDLQARIESLERSVEGQAGIIQQLRASLVTSETDCTQIKKELEETISENQQLTKDMDSNLEQIKEFMEEVQSANEAKDDLEKSNKVLKLEQRKLAAEVASLRARASIESSEEAKKFNGFKRNLADQLEKVGVQAQLMDQDQLLDVLKRSVESAKRAEQLEAEKRTLQRLAENSEAEVEGRITLITVENNQLKAKLRDSTEQLKRSRDELTAVESAVIRAKAGDTIDGEITSALVRDVMNLAVTAQENRVTKDEVTQLRLHLAENTDERDRLAKELEAMEGVQREVCRLRKQKADLIQEVTSMRQEKLDNDHEHSMDLLREGHDLQQERLRKQLDDARCQIEDLRIEVKCKDEQLSTLLDKYDITKQHSERKISGLHGILHQNNIALPKPRRKSPNQLGLPIMTPRPSSDDELSRKLRDKDEEIRLLRLAKRELEKLVCANTMKESSRMNDSRASFGNSMRSSYAPDSSADQRSRMPPPQAPPSREYYSTFDGRAWHEFREPPRESISNMSDSNFDLSSVKSMPTFRQVNGPAMTRSYSSRSLLHDVPGTHIRQTRLTESNEYSGRPYTQEHQLWPHRTQWQPSAPSDRASDIMPPSRRSAGLSSYSRAASGAASSSNLLMPKDIYMGRSLSAATLDKPLASYETSNNFENIGNGLEYKYDLRAAAGCAPDGGNRGASSRVGGLGGLGLGDDEEAQFMNPKNLEELERDGPSANGGSPPPSPNDPSRGDILHQRNQQVLPHLRSSYPVETQSGKVPVTPLLTKSFRM